MEYYVEVGTANFKETLFRKLSALRSEEGLPVELYELKNGACYWVRCVYSNLKGKQELDKLTARIYNYYFARSLAEIICQGWENLFIRKILKREYNLSKSDLDGIYLKACEYLNREDQSYLPETRKHILVKAILEYLDTHHTFDIEGFMNFRADQYKKELRRQVARAVNEFTLEQEHESFVGLLKRFLHSKRSIFKTMHIVIKDHGEVAFYDDRWRNINKECLEDNRSVFDNAAAGSAADDRKNNLELYEDFLISSLLKCAPKNLVVHSNTTKHQGMVQVIEEVFEDKISFCPGCSMCSQSN